MIPHKKELIKTFSSAIEERRLINLYYESKSSGKKWRKIEPYILAENQKGNLILVGLPIEELSKPIDKRVTGHYLLEKIEIDKAAVLSETYDHPEVARRRITDTPTINVIWRFIYNDEDAKTVKSQWLQVRYV